MSNQGKWILGLLACAALGLAACGADREAELVDIRTNLVALQAEVEALRRDVEDDASRAVEPTQPSGPSIEDFQRLESELAQVAQERNDRIESLEADTAARPAAEQLAPQPAEPTFTLQLLHAADMDGAAGALENVENFSAILDGFRSQFPRNTIVLSSGDNFIAGPRYFAAGDPDAAEALGVAGNGRADIALLNAMGFQASAMGNHELDRGTAAFAGIVGTESDDGGTYPGARFPYLSSNLEFTHDENLRDLVVADGQEAMLVGASLARSAVLTVDGERIGVVGATTPILAHITDSGDTSVSPADSDDVDALAAVIQEAVDDLVGQGINKVILLGHMQRIDIEQKLATRLRDVDIIVAGGSNTLLADDTDRLRAGDAAADTYPLRYETADGGIALLVNTDGDYRYLGRLIVGFDAEGAVIPESIDPHLSGAYATDRQGGQAFAGRPIPEVGRVVRILRGVLAARDGSIVGRTAVYLDGRRGAVRTHETNLGNLTADANLWLARQVDPEVRISLKNAGGIRGDIGRIWQPPGSTDPSQAERLPPAANPVANKAEGDISQFDIESALRFNNGLVILPLTARELVDVIEHAVGFDGVGEVLDGRFPVIAGMRFSFDPTAAPGQRIRSMAVLDGDGTVGDRVVENSALAGDPERRFKMVTLDFLADGGNDYPFSVPNPQRIDLSAEAGQFNAGQFNLPDPDFPDANVNGVIDESNTADPGLADFAKPGTEQDAFAEYLARFFSQTPFDVSGPPPLEDRRIQNLGIAGQSDTVFD